MTTLKKNPLIDRLMASLGAPQNVPDVAAYLHEFRRLTDGFGPNVLDKAADYLVRSVGRQWPTFRQISDACEDARAALTPHPTPDTDANRNMPWEARAREARTWAKDYIRLSALGRQSQEEGWSYWLEMYAMSYARNCPPGHKTVPLHEWRPSPDVIRDYRRYAGIR